MTWSEARTEVEDLERQYKGRSPLIEGKINDLYLKVFGINVRSGSCKEKFSDALIEIKLKAIKMSRKYNLKQHTVAVVWIDNHAHYLTMSNLTDELAEKAIEQHPEYKELFEIDKKFNDQREESMSFEDLTKNPKINNKSGKRDVPKTDIPVKKTKRKPKKDESPDGKEN